MAQTYDKWINWYHTVDTPAAQQPAPGPAPDPVTDPDPVVATSVPDLSTDQGFNVQTETSLRNLRKQRKDVAAIDFGTVKYATLNDYLKAENLGDRSGFFSGVDFGGVTKKDQIPARAGEALGAFDPNLLLLALPFGSAMVPSRQLQDPTGKFQRSIPVTGMFNPLATMAIAEEYRELYNIKEFNSKNPGVRGQKAGFGFSVGDVNIYRRPGESLYRGQLSKAGLDQQTARRMEEYVDGTKMGKDVVRSLLAKSDPNDDSPTTITLDEDSRVVLPTENGGYLLNGNFHFGSGIARYGYDEDMIALGASVFSADGQLPQQQSTALAQQWRRSAQALPRNATAAEKLANLEAHIKAATSLHQSNLVAQQEAARKADMERRKSLIVQGVLPEGYQAPTGVDFSKERDFYASVEEARKGMLRANQKGIVGRNERMAERARANAAQRESDREERQQGYEDRGMSETQARSASAEASRYEAMASAYGYAEGGDIPAEEEPFIAGAPDANEPMITGNELIEASGEESGFIDRPPSKVTDSESVADNKEMKADEGGYVINAAAVTEAGEQDISKMIKDAEDYLRREGREVSTEKSNQDILVSAGEVYVSKEVADVIGRDRLRKINNRGLPKTEEKIQKAAKGGRVGYAEGDEVQSFMDQPGEIPDVGDAPRMQAEIPENDITLFRGYLGKKGRHVRADVENLIDNLSDKGKLALLMLTETTALADPLESMEAVGQVAVNRMNTNDPDFDDVTSIADVLKQRSTGRGSGSKMFQFDGLEPTSVKNRLTEVMGGGAQAALDKIYSAADNVIDMNPRLGGEGADGREPAIPLSVLYYKKPGSEGGGFMDKRHYMEPYTTIGGHQFYNVNFEFPGRHSGR